MIISHMGGPNQAVSGNDLETSLIMRKGRGIILAMVVVLRQLNLLILFIAYFCPVKKIGNVLGKGGEIINALRGATHAKIRVADAVPGAEERVVMIFCYLWQSERNDSDQDPYDNDGIELEDMRSRCPAQDDLLKIHYWIAADEILRGGVIQENTEPDGVVTARIWFAKNQVGCLLGKGGTIIQ
ncbi:unnamed protein product [Musa acuminata subsp. malaccensis]|uniref:(wild Malaysian banana) hypothetical protein n=1 Tax=Musa acuminata subsp. malaccensis TaxID=214687 RepID=A0A8D7FAF7_MUSAM|nr:unnamed protein product [Musa acuminata subsp. malaccensis]